MDRCGNSGESSQRRKRSNQKEETGTRKGRKVAKHCVVSMFCGSGGSKSSLTKAAGAETSGQISNPSQEICSRTSDHV